jgi:hypothetical protein
MDNTNRANIRQARRYVQRLTTHDIRPRIGNANRGYRPCYSLRVHRANEIRVVLNAVMPWLVGRRRQAELMLGVPRNRPEKATGRQATRDAPFPRRSSSDRVPAEALQIRGKDARSKSAVSER